MFVLFQTVGYAQTCPSGGNDIAVNGSTGKLPAAPAGSHWRSNGGNTATIDDQGNISGMTADGTYSFLLVTPGTNCGSAGTLVEKIYPDYGSAINGGQFGVDPVGGFVQVATGTLADAAPKADPGLYGTNADNTLIFSLWDRTIHFDNTSIQYQSGVTYKMTVNYNPITDLFIYTINNQTLTFHPGAYNSAWATGQYMSATMMYLAAGAGQKAQVDNIKLNGNLLVNNAISLENGAGPGILVVSGYDYYHGFNVTADVKFTYTTAPTVGGELFFDYKFGRTNGCGDGADNGCVDEVVVTKTTPVCVNPTAGTPAVTPATCNAAGTAANNNASIVVSGITNGTSYAFTTDGSAPAYMPAQTVSGGVITLSSLANPASATTYTIRIFNGSADCFTDVTATLQPKSCVPVSCDCPGNLLVNPGFETGDFTGWTLATNDPGQTSFAGDNTYAVCGSHYAYFNPTAGNATDTVAYYQDLPASVGEKFDLSVYSGVHDPRLDHQLRLQFFNSSNQLLSGGQVVQVDNDVENSPFSLIQYTLSGTAPAGTSYVRIMAYVKGAYIDESIALKVDGFCLTKTPAVCVNPTVPTPVVTLATCNAAGTAANNDASVVVSGITNGLSYAFTTDGSTPTFASAQAISGGVITFSSLANPAAAITYTIRVFNGSADCFTDVTATINPKTCTPTCVNPTTGTPAVTLATCNASGTAANNDASILITNITNGTSYAFTTDGSAPVYAPAQTISGGTITLSSLANPAVATTYTFRFFNGSADCFTDVTATLNPKVCTCVTPTAGTPAVTPATCNAAGTAANNDASILIANINNGTSYAYTTDGSTPTFASAQPIAGGIITLSGLANPAVATTYTFRIFDVAASCYLEVTATLNPKTCTPNCVNPTVPTPVVTQATCNVAGTAANNDASIVISGITNGLSYAFTTDGSTPTFASAQAISGGVITFASLANPAAAITYTIRVFNGSADCFTDVTATLNPKVCTPACAIVTTATPGACAPATNQYTVTGTISLTSAVAGTATITDGTSTTTVAITAGAASVDYSLVGLASDGASHTVTVSLPGCGTATATYTAPASCTVATSIVVTSATVCYGNSATLVASGCAGTVTWNTGDTGNTLVTPALTALTNYTATCTTASSTATAVGTVTVMPQAILSLQTSSTLVTVSTPVSLSAIGCVGTVNWSTGETGSSVSVTPANATNVYSATCNTGPGCTATASITINTLTPSCQLALVVTPGQCNLATNQYSITGSVSATNGVGNQVVTITAGTASTTLTLSSNGPASFTLTGLVSDGLAHTVGATLSGCGTASMSYTAPASCTYTCPPPVHVCKGTSYAIKLSTTVGQSSYQWYRDGVAIPSATASSYTATQAGSYSVVLNGNVVGQCPDGSCCPIVIVEDSVALYQANAQAPSCNSATNTANADGRILVSQWKLSPSDTAHYYYQVSLGSSFNAGQVVAGSVSQQVPVDGVLVANLPNPAGVSGQSYTVRITNGLGCFRDIVVNLAQSVCNCPPAKCLPLVIVKIR